MALRLPISPFLIEQSRFLARLIKNPRNVGAIAPSSAALARAMAAQIPSRSGRVLELGPGTGVVTNAILARGIAPSQLTVIEYDPQFARVIAERFPGINVVQADAFQLSRVLGETEKFHAIVSSLPLLNFAATMREALIAEIFARLAADAPFIQFSYGLNPPVPAPKGGSVMRVAHVILNLPPARVWVYRKPHS